MNKRTFFILIIIISAFILTFFVKNANAQRIECDEGYVKKHARYDLYRKGVCYNSKTNLSYDVVGAFYLKGVNCGFKCDKNGKNCKWGYCDANELVQNGYTKIEYNRIKNSNTNLSFNGDLFYLNGHLCGSNCSLDGKKCKYGYCDEQKLKNYGFTEIKDGKFYNPLSTLAFRSSCINCSIFDFYINGENCGKDCKLDGTNCKTGFCDIKSCNKSKGYTKIRKEKCYNPITHLSYSQNEDFFIDDIKCGNGCNPDGTNCKTGACSLNSGSKNYIEMADGKEYNPTTHLYNSNGKFSINGVDCGSDCNTDGSNCKLGYCNLEEIKKHGYTETTDYKYYYFKENGSKHSEYGKAFYNPKTHIAFDRYNFYFKKIPCGYKCDLDGNNCEKGICNAKNCKTGYKNLDIVELKSLEPNILFYDINKRRKVVCRNDSKTSYYLISEPDNIKSFITKDLKIYSEVSEKY